LGGGILELERLACFGRGVDRLSGIEQRCSEKVACLRTVRLDLDGVLELDDRCAVFVLGEMLARRCDIARRGGSAPRRKEADEADGDEGAYWRAIHSFFS